MAKLLIENGILMTLGEPCKVLKGHALLLENGHISRIAPQEEFNGSYDRVLDAKGKVVLPGFINAHMHFYSTLVRGLGKAEPSRDFAEVLQNLWWRLDRKLSLQDSYISAKIMLINAIRHGTTTLIDHHASPGAVRGSLAEIARAVCETGLRACLCYEVSDRDGEDITREGLEENVEWIQSCQKNPDGSLKAMFGLHAAFTLNESTLAHAGDLGRSLGTGFHIHVAEAVSDVDFNLKHFGERVVPRLRRHGILGPNSIAAHCVHIDPSEMESLAETNTIVVHNPQSNLNNAVGIADLMGLQRAGVMVGLGTDAMTVKMLEEARVALWAQHLRNNHPNCAFMEVAQALLVNNPKIAERIWNQPMGVLREGAVADVICVDYHPMTPLDESTAYGHLIFGISQAIVDTTIVGGQILMEAKELKLNIDEEELDRESQSLAQSLWERF